MRTTMNRKTIVRKKTNMQEVAEAVARLSKRGTMPTTYITDWLDAGDPVGMTIRQLCDSWDDGLDEGARTPTAVGEWVY